MVYIRVDVDEVLNHKFEKEFHDMSLVHNIFEFGQAWWAEARKKVKNAVVFLDPVACECLHWNGGAPSILEAGASSIKELSTFEASIRVPNLKIYEGPLTVLHKRIMLHKRIRIVSSFFNSFTL